MQHERVEPFFDPKKDIKQQIWLPKHKINPPSALDSIFISNLEKSIKTELDKDLFRKQIEHSFFRNWLSDAKNIKP